MTQKPNHAIAAVREKSRKAQHEAPYAARSRTRAIVGGVAASAAMVGAAIFNRSRAARAERDTPPIGRFIEIDGVRLHYVERGSGPAVVLLHGNGAMIQDYEISGVLDGAAREHRVIAFDRPGFGHSERPRTTMWTPTAQAELMFKALQALEVERPIVVGHSWGTLAALAMALDQPGAIGGLVLLSGYYFPTARPDVLLFSPPAIPGVGDVLRYTVSPLIGRAMAPAMFKTMFAPAPIPERFAQWPVELAMRPSQLRASAADTAMMTPAAGMLSRRYAELTLPVIIVGGTGDKIAHFDRHAEALHAVLPSSELVTIEDEGHMLHYGACDRVLRAIERAGELAGA